LNFFGTEFPKILKYQISFKIRPMRAESFHEDGRTDRQTRRS